MPITTNAKSAADKRMAKQLVNKLAKTVGDDIVDIKFMKTLVKVTHGDDLTRMSRDRFDAWADAGYPWGDDGPKDPANGTEKAEKEEPGEVKSEEVESTEIETAPAPKAQKATKAPRKKAEASEDVLDDLVTQAFEIEEEERSGSDGRNAARFRRGELMVRLKGISEATKTPVKALLTMLNERTIALASQHSIPDFHTISESEASDTRKVVTAFGSSGEFRHVYGVDPATGNAMTMDDGSPYALPITSVALNKLVPLTEYADKEDPDRLLSFAHSQTEKIVKKAKSVSKRLERPMLAVAEDIAKMRVKKPSPLGPDVGEVDVPPDEKEILDALREMVGEKPQEDVASIRTSRAWYEATWLPIRALISKLAATYFPNALSETTHEVSNVFILERLVTAYFDPMEDAGVQRILGAMVHAEEMSEAQADEFVNSFAYDPDEDEWVRVESGVTEEDAEAIDSDDEEGSDDEPEEADEDDELAFDDEYDIDDPESAEEDEEDF